MQCVMYARGTSGLRDFGVKFEWSAKCEENFHA
jgi:hypothetical protein